MSQNLSKAPNRVFSIAEVSKTGIASHAALENGLHLNLIIFGCDLLMTTKSLLYQETANYFV